MVFRGICSSKGIAVRTSERSQPSRPLPQIKVRMCRTRAACQIALTRLYITRNSRTSLADCYCTARRLACCSGMMRVLPVYVEVQRNLHVSCRGIIRQRSGDMQRSVRLMPPRRGDSVVCWARRRDSSKTMLLYGEVLKYFCERIPSFLQNDRMMVMTAVLRGRRATRQQGTAQQ